MIGLLVAVLGVRDFLLVQAPITLLASSAGVWLFYVQPSSSTPTGRGARTGTSTPAPCTQLALRPAARAALVHGEHRHPSCPSSVQPNFCYRLGEALRDHPELQDVSRLTLKESVRCLGLALWDEDQRRLVGFLEARASRVSGPRNDRVRTSSSASLRRRLSARSSGRTGRASSGWPQKSASPNAGPRDDFRELRRRRPTNRPRG